MYNLKSLFVQIILILFTQSIFSFPLNIEKKEETINIEGRWEGTITRDEGSGKRSFFSMELDVKQKKKDISGYSIVSYEENGKKFYSKMEFKGKINGTYVKYEETKILQADTVPGAEWCIKKADLIYRTNGNTPKLEGIWEGKVSTGNRPCMPGRIDLSKKPPRV